MRRTSSVGILLLVLAGLAAASHAQIITESARDFSAVQGQGAWSYGFFTAPFTPATFQLLPVYGTNSRNNIGWMLTTNPPPWTRVTRHELHPAAPNDSDLPIQWAVRRWQSTYDGVIRISGSIYKSASSGSTIQDGVVGYVLVDGTPVYTRSVARNNTTGYEFSLEIPVTPGTLVDFAVAPNANDLVDATTYRVTIATADPPARWVAFNDHYSGQHTHPNATAWNVFTNAANAPGNSGLLKNIATGAELPVALTITNVHATGGFTAASPTNDSVGYSIFHGFVDFGSANSGTDHSILTAATNNAVVAFVFTGLAPTNEYSFRGISVRGDPAYTNRWSLCEIAGAGSFVKAHSSGVLTSKDVSALASNQAAFNSGDNSADGEVVGWDRIRTTNGSFTVLCRQYTNAVPGGSTAGAPYAYAFSAIRLSEYAGSAAPIMTIPQLNAGTLTLSFTTEAGRNYAVEYQQQLQPGPWEVLTNVPGTGALVPIMDITAVPGRFYRVRVQ
ncbi:MAG TPA: hypothetical protein VGF13_08880 [Verrucomicrobiae bacterium]